MNRPYDKLNPSEKDFVDGMFDRSRYSLAKAAGVYLPHDDRIERVIDALSEAIISNRPKLVKLCMYRTLSAIIEVPEDIAKGTSSYCEKESDDITEYLNKNNLWPNLNDMEVTDNVTFIRIDE